MPIQAVSHRPRRPVCVTVLALAAFVMAPEASAADGEPTGAFVLFSCCLPVEGGPPGVDAVAETGDLRPEGTPNTVHRHSIGYNAANALPAYHETGTGVSVWFFDAPPGWGGDGEPCPSESGC